jgi:PPM family protein phosphatase
MTVQTFKGQILSYAATQDVGRRENQEDRFLVQEMTTRDGLPAVLAIVADGIGGNNQGQTASQMACESVPAHLAAGAPNSGQIGRALRKALEDTCREIYEASLLDPGREGMGTTCTAIVVVDRRLYLAHVGDTRAYLLHNEQLRQLSIDHTWAQEAIRAGFPVEEIRRHPNRGVLRRYLGVEPTVDVDTRYFLAGDNDTMADSLMDPLPLAPGDVLMLCSDGMADLLDNSDILPALHSGKPDQAATALVQMALQAGASDNITVAVLRLNEADGKVPRLWSWFGRH